MSSFSAPALKSGNSPIVPPSAGSRPPASTKCGIDSLSPADRSVLGRLLGLCWEDRTLCLQVLTCQALLLAVGLLGLCFTGAGIDYLRFYLQPAAKAPIWPFGLQVPPEAAPLTVILVVAGVILLAAAVRGILTWIGGLLLAKLVHEKIVSRLQNAVFSKLQHLSFSFFDQRGRGEIINRATGDIQSIRTFVDTVLVQAVITVISIAIYMAYMLAIDVGLTVACLATLPLMWIACLVFSKQIHPFYEEARVLLDRLILALAESVEGVSVLKGFAREAQADERFRTCNRAVRDQQYGIFQRVSLFTPGIDFLTHVNLLVLLVYGGLLVIHGRMALGTGLVVFAGLLQQFSNQVVAISQIANGVQESLTGAARVFAILDAPLGLPVSGKPKPLPVAHGLIEFRQVSFGYGTQPILQDIDLTVNAGECVAIVGETGAGKTALLNLIPRFYDATHGSVSIDGCDVRSVDLQDLRRRVRVVFQESFLFSDTVAANICFGQSGASREAMIAAAKAAQAHEFIERLPRGYQTILGESGIDLSGGQRQRLAIARALLTDPAILLLDDPTAAIDSETEHEILAAIDHATLGRTTVIVAHRLSTLRRADRIIVLDRGRIAQSGTHAELVRVSGAYQRAALHQMSDAESRLLLAEEIAEADETCVPAEAKGASGLVEVRA